MTKRDLFNYLEEELRDIPDDSNIIISDGSGFITYPGGLEIQVVCGGQQAFMPYYCIRTPNHEGECYCAIKHVEFNPESKEKIQAVYDTMKDLNDIARSMK